MTMVEYLHWAHVRNAVPLWKYPWGVSWSNGSGTKVVGNSLTKTVTGPRKIEGLRGGLGRISTLTGKMQDQQINMIETDFWVRNLWEIPNFSVSQLYQYPRRERTPEDIGRGNGFFVRPWCWYWSVNKRSSPLNDSNVAKVQKKWFILNDTRRKRLKGCNIFSRYTLVN